MKTVMSNRFHQIPHADIQRSSFDRTHGHKTTFDAGLLIPVFVDEALPGDTFNLNMTAFARLATPLKPVMDNMFMESFFFAVPNRLLWDNWQKFNGEQDNPGDSTDFLIPTTTNTYTQGSLGDYFGLPTEVDDLTVNSLHHRAYQMIWNDFFRDENLQDSIPIDKGDGPDSSLNNDTVLRRGKRHDYFTSCLPWPQKTENPVTIPLGGNAPIVGDGNVTYVYNDQDTAEQVLFMNAADNNITSQTGFDGHMKFSSIAGNIGLVADFSQATAATINELREAFQIQKLYERDARGGTRYTEIIKSHFGVTSPDSRLQRPEYLGGGSTPVSINPVTQTTQDIDGAGANTPQGNMAAYGTITASNHAFTKSFTEHCVIIGMVCVRADLTYQQGLNRMWSRQTRFDYYWPALSHIGEQEVFNKEIFAQGTAADEDIFGYQERYAEYRYKPSTITGKFRSNFAQSLDIWHLSQDFANLPVLNAEFIEEHPPLDRIIAVPDEPHFLFDSYIRLRCARPMPTYSIPGLMDHF